MKINAIRIIMINLMYDTMYIRTFAHCDWVFNITFHFCRNETSPSVTTWESHRLQLAVFDVKYFSTCMRFSDLQLWNGYERSSHAVLQPLALHCATHVLCDVHRKLLISSRIAIRSICLCASNGNCICLTDSSHFQHPFFEIPFNVSQL